MPAACRMAADNAQVEPFPFVPATWIAPHRRSGCPSAAISARIRSREKVSAAGDSRS